MLFRSLTEPPLHRIAWKSIWATRPQELRTRRRRVPTTRPRFPGRDEPPARPSARDGNEDRIIDRRNICLPVSRRLPQSVVSRTRLCEVPVASSSGYGNGRRLIHPESCRGREPSLHWHSHDNSDSAEMRRAGNSAGNSLDSVVWKRHNQLVVQVAE